MANNAENLNSRFFIIDPQPSGLDVFPPEDLFMYVKFSVREKPRSIYSPDIGLNNIPSAGAIDFITSRVEYETDGDAKTILNDGKSYTTTDWTNIGGLNDKGTGVLEGFGINSININYGASLVPQVDITFTDVRGGALFDGISQDSKSSLYSVFFKLPYPVFELTVKGYYGKPVTYCLHLVNWSSDFDGSSGNFNIKAKFVGFQQAFLADMVMQNVIATINTSGGASELAKLNIKDSNGVISKTDPLDVFISKINKFLSQGINDLKEGNEVYEQLQKINNQIQSLKQIKSFIGFPLKKNEESDQNSNEIDNNTVNTAVIGVGRRNIEYISVRDFIAVKSQYVSTDNGGSNTDVGLSDSESKIFDFFTKKFIELRENFNNLNTETLKENFKRVSTPGSLTSTFIDENGLLPTEFYTSGTTHNKQFKLSDVKLSDYVGQGKFSSNGNDEVVVYNMYDVRAEVDDLLNKLLQNKKDKLKEWGEEINKSLSKKLEFNPKIRTVFQIILNNIQAMMTTIYNTAYKAESPSLQSNRLDVLKKIAVKTDIRDNNLPDVNKKIVYPFPMVYEEDSDDIVWLGDYINENDETTFPEIALVNEAILGYVKTTNNFAGINNSVTIKSEEDWFPINPLDINKKPFTNYNWNRLRGSIDKKFIEDIITRCAVINGFSQYNGNFNRNIGYYDGAFSTFQILDSKYRDIIQQNFNVEDFLNYGVESDLLEKQGDVYYLSENTGTTQSDNEQINFGGYDISLFKDDTTYLFISDICGNNYGNKVIDKVLSIDTRIENSYRSKIEKNVFDEKVFNNIKNDKNKAKRQGLRYFNGSNLTPTENFSYLVWGRKDLITDNNVLSESYELIFEKQIQSVDGIDNEYIGVLTPKEKVTNKNERYLVFSELFTSSLQSLEGQALMLLNTLPFDSPKKMIEELSDVSKIIELPFLYVVWLGGTLWRKQYYLENNDDPIKWSDTDATLIVEPIGINKFLSNIGKNVYGNNDDIPQILLNLPNSAKEHFIETFKKWVSNGQFRNFYDSVIEYNQSFIDSNTEQKNKSSDRIYRELIKEISIVSLTPEIWRDNGGEKKRISFTTQQFNEYCDSFLLGFENLNGTVTQTQIKNKTLSDAENKEKTINNKDIKIAFYKFYKNIYDKWIAGTKDGKVFNTCVIGGDDKDLIDYFNFVDRGWNDLGDEAAINLNSLVTLINNPETNAYFYLSKILRDSNFILQILPSFVNFRDVDEVNKMFTPQVTLEDSNSGPAYVCIKAGGNSNSLEIKDIDYRYKDDSMNFDRSETIKNIASGKESKDYKDITYNVVAFRVAFGKQNQSIFKNVSLNQEEHRETGEYFKVLSDLVDKRGGTQKSYFGNDLYKAYSVRSYKCDIEAMGCMNIQPLMYFQLDNVPFFRGAYLIMNVSHSITPNHITTNFSGVRQSSITLPTVTDISSYITLDTDETTDDFDLPEIVRPTRISTEFGVSDPETTFNFALLNTGNLNNLEFSNDFITALASNNNDNFSEVLTTFGLTTNEDVTFFLSNLAYESRYGKDREEIWNSFDCGGGNETQKSYGATGNNLGNQNQQDGYDYRKRGYISILGRNEYTEANSNPNVSNLIVGITNTNNLIDNPDLVSQSPYNALVVSAYKYKKIKDSVSAEIPKNTPKGSGVLFEFYSKKLANKEVLPKGRTDAFERILDTLKLKDVTNIG